MTSMHPISEPPTLRWMLLILTCASLNPTVKGPALLPCMMYDLKHDRCQHSDKGSRTRGQTHVQHSLPYNPLT